MSESSSLIAGVHFPWKHIAGFYMCVRSFTPFANITGDDVDSPIPNKYGLIMAELPNPDVDIEQRVLTIPIEHKSDFKTLYRAYLDNGVTSGINELVILYEHRKSLFGGRKPSFHVAAFPKGTWQKFFEAVENYASSEFKWPKPLFLFQPSSTCVFPSVTNLFSN